MDGLERLWATWRQEYVTGKSSSSEQTICILCDVARIPDASEQNTHVHSGSHCAVVLNAFPYTNGHVMIVPYEHVERLDQVTADARSEIFDFLYRTTVAIQSAYSPDGLNLGANIGQGSGAGIPDHLHFHALPRWNSDTNFMTTVAGARVIPEDLALTLEKLRLNFK
ncbi:MAG: HIT domain-containing protein [Actinobacteria bacterium]|nr:HIT domain-containing protein [Actinomycetota bacterium]